MSNATRYFELARKEEKDGNFGSALLFYLSSFCDSFNSCADQYPYGTTAKIQQMRRKLFLTENELLAMVRSYGILTDLECRHLLYYSIHGYLPGIKAVLSGGVAAYGY